MTYILTNGLFGFSLEILQPGLFMWNYIKSHTWHRGKRKTAYLNSIPYYRIIPFVALSILIGMVYAIISPLLLPFLVGYLLLGYVVFINQVISLSFKKSLRISYFWNLSQFAFLSIFKPCDGLFVTTVINSSDNASQCIWSLNKIFLWSLAYRVMLNVVPWHAMMSLCITWIQ